MIPGSLFQQYGNPHALHLDMGTRGLPYRPGGIYSMQDRRSRDQNEYERQRKRKIDQEKQWLQYTLAAMLKGVPQAP